MRQNMKFTIFEAFFCTSISFFFIDVILSHICRQNKRVIFAVASDFLYIK